MEKKPAPVEVKIADVPTPEQLNQAFLTGDWSDLKVKPKSNCKRCYGRGYEGRNTQTGKLVVCGCVIKQIQKLMKGQKNEPIHGA